MAIIPITEALADLLDDLRGRYRRDNVNNVLVNSYRLPWTGNGLGGSFNLVRDAVGITHIDEDGRVRKKHLHDLRGTSCTMLIAERDLTDAEAAEVMGWSSERVRDIRKIYVDDSPVVMAIAERIASKRRARLAAAQPRAPRAEALRSANERYVKSTAPQDLPGASVRDPVVARRDRSGPGRSR